MNSFIVLVLLAVSVNCQSPAFDSFMSRNRQLFSSDVSVSSGATAQSIGQQSSQQLPSWQQQQLQPQSRSSFGRSLTPSVTFASESSSPFVTSNSHIQAFNPPQSAGSPTTISGPNFQTSITLPALPPLPQHPAGSPAALAQQQLLQQQQQQSQQFQPRSQPQPQLTQQFTSHVHNHQIPSQLANQPSQASGSFFNPQGNTNFPFNFQAPSSAPLSFPTPPSTPPTAPQSFDSFGFNSLQGSNNFFTNPQQQQPLAQPQAQQSSAPWSSSSFGQPSTTIKAPGFETTFVFMRPSEQPDQAASLSKLIRGPNGVERQMFFVPMPNYSPPTVFNHQIVHSNPQQQGQQQ